jgi:hypothetical protein
VNSSSNTFKPIEQKFDLLYNCLAYLRAPKIRFTTGSAVSGYLWQKSATKCSSDCSINEFRIYHGCSFNMLKVATIFQDIVNVFICDGPFFFT